ncbi:MAG: RNA methyltransferase, partial [Verrucomicrobiae bacterium]|nr:RNA methyltransferase [Verrucomicrobiae bacterium]
MRKPDQQTPDAALTAPPPAWFANIAIILIEPAEPGNIGAAARAIKTMGLSQLVVVNGVDFKTDVQARRMAHGALDILDNARMVRSWDEAVADLHWLIGTTHRRRRAQFADPLTAVEAARRLLELAPRHRVGLVFGREASGLTDAELRRCNEISSVPSGAAHPSMNLAQAVMVYAYELYQQSRQAPPPRRHPLATVEEVEHLLRHMGESLAKVGFRAHQGDPETFLRSLRRVLSRA